MIVRTIFLVIAAILFFVAFVVVLFGAHFYTVSHIRELTNAGLFCFVLSFFPWRH